MDADASGAIPRRTATGGTRVFLIASGFRKPDHAAQRVAAPAAIAAAKAGSDYLETRVVPGGGIGIAHSTWPGDVQPDPQGNASAASANTRLWQVTGEQVYRERATRILDSLADVLLPSGGFGFPWAYGIANSHFAYPGHYPDGRTHPRGSVMAIITDNAATSLLEGYHAFGARAYLEAAQRAVDYLLHDAAGLQFLDPDEWYASIPYCSMAPIDANGGRATEVYNIDGASLVLLRKLYETTGDGSLLGYSDALARNLNRRVETDGSVPYAWYPSGKPTGYAYIVYGGLLQGGELRHIKQWVATARRGISWMTNVDRPSAMLWEYYTEPLGGVDNTQDVIGWINTTTGSLAGPTIGTEVTRGHREADLVGLTHAVPTRPRPRVEQPEEVALFAFGLLGGHLAFDGTHSAMGARDRRRTPTRTRTWPPRQVRRGGHFGQCCCPGEGRTVSA
ncbi:hypothetical protein ABZV93_27410 [Actinopolymorpha sp. NPDC004070]|uniref:hypothetical protein n=1 Tax=Actinopolymorpha sp. NPDC004070 TaxID=3154548 RepID=UPI0033A8BECF